MSNKKKGVALINSRTPAEAKEHRREVLAAVHECNVRGFAYDDKVDALRSRFNVTKEMARQYITWYKQEQQQKRHVDFEERRRLIWDRYEHMFGKATELAEISGDYKQAIDITKEQNKWLEAQEKRLASMSPEALVQHTQVPLSERTAEERAILRRLIEIQLDRQNTSATLVITPQPQETDEATGAHETEDSE